MRHFGSNPNHFLGIGALPIALAGGSWLFLGFLVLMFFAIAYGYFTERGSGISARPYGKIYGGAPGAFGPGSASGKDSRERVDWSRGTR
jgi:hypothetical protein